MSTKSSKLADNMAGAIVLGRSTLPQEPPAAPIEEIVARFQIDTERLIASIRSDHQRQIIEQERKVAALQDEWTRTRTEVEGLRKDIQQGVHEVNEGVKETQNALRRAVEASQKAGEAVAVFEKLKASQPDFHKMVSECRRETAAARDAVQKLGDLVATLGKKLDEFEMVADDYEETKGAVRGIDVIVKDLNAEARQRRQVGVTR